jgi:exonuclease III
MNQSWIDEFEKERNMTNECGMELIILGDINIDYKDGCTNNKWSNMILDQSLTQLIDKPTRVATHL